MVDPVKLRRRKIVRAAIALVLLAIAFVFIFMARGLLLPIFVAFVLAYVFKPLVYSARLKGISRSVAVTSIVVGLFAFLIISFKLIERALPKGMERLEKQTRIQYQLNQNMKSFFNLADENSEGSFTYKYLHSEIDTMMKAVNGILKPNPSDIESLQWVLKSRDDESATKMLDMLNANNSHSRWASSADDDINLGHSMPHFAVSQLATWLLLPIVFFFLLIDDGSMFRFFLGFIPNSYFELALTVHERVDKALGHYLRGTALECGAVGVVVAFGLLVFGVDITGSIAIGFIAGILNAIPFLGMMVALVFGIVYVVMLDQVTPWLPFLTKDHLMLGVCISIGVAHLLDNAIFQPLLVGRAVNLHPLGVILTVAASGTAFGFMGVLLAIPATVTIKVCIETVYSGLRDYRLM